MPFEVETDKVVCTKCGKSYPRRRGNFRVSYAACHKGIGYIPICESCVDSMYKSYLAQCNNSKDAVRQMCRKLDLYWNESVYESAEKKGTAATILSLYIQAANRMQYAGKSYDDTLCNEGTMWSFTGRGDASSDTHREQNISSDDASYQDDDLSGVSDEVISFWGSGYTAEMYNELEQRRSYWTSRLPDGEDVDIGTGALIRQICPLELDINKYRMAGRDTDKLVATLDKLIGSAGLKPGKRRLDDAETTLANTPLGVWLYRYEQSRPLPDVDEELKDVNGIRKYVFTWMGHLCKMLGIKNSYSKLYEDEVSRLSVDKPEYEDDDDYPLFSEDIPPDIRQGGVVSE